MLSHEHPILSADQKEKIKKFIQDINTKLDTLTNNSILNRAGLFVGYIKKDSPIGLITDIKNSLPKLFAGIFPDSFKLDLNNNIGLHPFLTNIFYIAEKLDTTGTNPNLITYLKQDFIKTLFEFVEELGFDLENEWRLMKYWNVSIYDRNPFFEKIMKTLKNHVKSKSKNFSSKKDSSKEISGAPKEEKEEDKHEMPLQFAQLNEKEEKHIANYLAEKPQPSCPPEEPQIVTDPEHMADYLERISVNMPQPSAPEEPQFVIKDPQIFEASLEEPQIDIVDPQETTTAQLLTTLQASNSFSDELDPEPGEMIQSEPQISEADLDLSIFPKIPEEKEKGKEEEKEESKEKVPELS